MGKLKKTAESGQLWELISQQFFAENTHNFAQCCVNSPRISEIFCFEKTEEERDEKGKKTCCSCLLRSSLVSKNLSW